MEASKISFSQQTKAALTARPLGKVAKAKLRRERVKDYIRSKPAGTIIKQTELAAAAGYDQSQGHGWAFINRMVKKGYITKDTSEGAHKPSWTVRGDDRTVKPKKSELPSPAGQPILTKDNHEHHYIGDVCEHCGLLRSTIEQPKESFSFATQDVKVLEQVSTGWVVQRAKEFAWQYNSNDLREFVRLLETSVK